MLDVDVLNKDLNQFTLLKNWLLCDKKVLGLKAGDVLIMCCLLNHVSKNSKGNFTCYPSHSTLAKECGMGLTAVKSAIAKLEDKKLVISYQRKDNSKVYTILWGVEAPAWDGKVYGINKSKINKLKSIRDYGVTEEKDIELIEAEIEDVMKCGGKVIHK